MYPNLRTLFLSFITASCITTANAIPAYKGLIKTKQPSGQNIHIYLHGDEHFHWAQSPDGYTLLRDKDNFWTFAQTDAIGNIIPSTLRYNNTSELAIQAGIPKQLKPNQPAYHTRTSSTHRTSTLQVDNSFPTKGKHKLLLLLLNYANTETTYTQEQFNNFMNAQGYGDIGSFRDYYLNQSYGQLDIETTVLPWHTLKGRKSDYGSEGAIAMISEALRALEDQIDLSQFDNDGDKILDGLAVIHQGTGQEMTGSPSDIWSHSSEIEGLTIDGITIRRYTIQPEKMPNGSMTNIGVICHEFGHNLGAPDFYDTDYDQTGGEYCGTGVWDLMGSGAWNGEQANRPAGINIWQKCQFGWVTPTTLDASETIQNMPPISQEPIAYKINTTVPGEYFILENRQQQGPFDIALPGSGLLIYHVDEKKIAQCIGTNTLNITHPQAIYTICANSNSSPSSEPTSYGNINTAAAPFPGTASITAFSDFTLPSSRSQNGRMSYFALEQINNKDTGISFEFKRMPVPPSPKALKAEAIAGKVFISWETPEIKDSYGTPDFYTVYCNNIEIGQTTDNSFEDTEPLSNGLLNYSVDATYLTDLISPYVTTSILVPSNKLSELNCIQENGQNTLRWSLDKHLTRLSFPLTADGHNEFTVEGRDSIDYAQLFSSSDLTIYKGCQITQVTFFPLTKPSLSSYEIRIWETDKNGKNPHIVSRKSVTEFGTATWNQVMLPSPVTLIKGRSYYIGVHLKTTDPILPILTDNGPYQPGGCLIKQDNTWSEPQNITGQFCIYATINYPQSKRPTPLPQIPEVQDPLADLIFPLGFKIYRNGQEIGTTSSLFFIDETATKEKYEYAVSCLYKGNNESKSQTVVFDPNPSSLLEQVTEKPRLIIEANGTVHLSQIEDNVRLYDISGRMLSSRYVNGKITWILPNGFYIIYTSKNQPIKFTIKSR